MSAVHYTYVGHFDPRSVDSPPVKCLRPIDLDRVNRLLAEFPRGVAAQVQVRGGFALCHWTAPEVGPQVYEFAYRLAREEGCLAVENGMRIAYPPEEAQAQRARWEQMRPSAANPGP
jgi:hypothetical protein